jgi:hypothetical protein
LLHIKRTPFLVTASVIAIDLFTALNVIWHIVMVAFATYFSLREDSHPVIRIPDAGPGR